MAMIEGHDYVKIFHWDCPYCHKFNGETKVGRYPYGSKLLCQGCGMEVYPAHAENVYYGPTQDTTSKEEE